MILFGLFSNNSFLELSVGGLRPHVVSILTFHLFRLLEYLLAKLLKVDGVSCFMLSYHFVKLGSEVNIILRQLLLEPTRINRALLVLPDCVT